MCSQCLLFSFQFTVYISHGLGNSQILKLALQVEFLLFKKNTAIKSYSVSGLQISKELKGLSEGV